MIKWTIFWQWTNSWKDSILYSVLVATGFHWFWDSFSMHFYITELQMPSLPSRQMWYDENKLISNHLKCKVFVSNSCYEVLHSLAILVTNAFYIIIIDSKLSTFSWFLECIVRNLMKFIFVLQTFQSKFSDFEFWLCTFITFWLLSNEFQDSHKCPHMNSDGSPHASCTWLILLIIKNLVRKHRQLPKFRQKLFRYPVHKIVLYILLTDFRTKSKYSLRRSFQYHC